MERAGSSSMRDSSILRGIEIAILDIMAKQPDKKHALKVVRSLLGITTDQARNAYSKLAHWGFIASNVGQGKTAEPVRGQITETGIELSAQQKQLWLDEGTPPERLWLMKEIHIDVIKLAYATYRASPTATVTLTGPNTGWPHALQATRIIASTLADRGWLTILSASQARVPLPKAVRLRPEAASSARLVAKIPTAYRPPRFL